MGKTIRKFIEAIRGKDTFKLTAIAKQIGTTIHHLCDVTKPLKASGQIKMIGYGTWQNNLRYGGDPPAAVVEEVRGHGFLFKATLPKKLLLETRLEIINKAGIPSKTIKNHNKPYALSFKFKDYRVRFTEQSILIWQPKNLSWYGINALEARNKAIADFRQVIQSLQATLGVLFPERLKIASNHYALIKNDLAKQYNKSKEKLYVEDAGGLWLIIDNSWNLDELETVHPKTALENNIIVQQDFNELKETHLTRKKLKGLIDQTKQQTELNTNHIGTLTKTLTKFIEASTPQTIDESMKANPLRINKNLRDYIG